MGNCSIIRNPKTNHIESVLAPNGKDSLLYKDAINHLREVKDDVIKDLSNKEGEFKFKEDGVEISLSRNEDGRVYLTEVKFSPESPIETVFNRVLDRFDKEEIPLYINGNINVSEKILANAGFMEDLYNPKMLHRDIEKFKAIPSEHLKEQALTLWHIAYTDTFAETMGKWNFTEEELKEARNFIKQRKREIEQAQTYNALKGRILAEKYENLQKSRSQYQVSPEEISNEELLNPQELEFKREFQDKVLRKIQNVFTKKFHNFNIVRNIEDFTNRIDEENLLRTNGGKIMGAVLDDGSVFIDKEVFFEETFTNYNNDEQREKTEENVESENPIIREIQNFVRQIRMSERGNTEELIGRKGDEVSNESGDTNLGGVESNRESVETLLNSESLIPERFQLSTEEIFGVDTVDMKQVPTLSVSKYLEDKYATDSNGEPLLKDILVMDNIMRNWKAAITPAEIYKLSNDFGNVVDSMEELYQEINKTFFPNGYFQIKADLIMESKLYSTGEAITLLNHPEIQRNVQRLFEAVRKEYMSNNIYLENTLDNSKFSEELVQYKDEVDDLGKVQKEDPVEVENYFKEYLAGVRDRGLFNSIVRNMNKYPQFVKRFENDLGFSEMIFSKYSNMTKIFRLQDIKGEIRVRRKGATFSKMFETLKHSEKGLEIGQDTAFLKRIDNFVWESNAKEVVKILRDIEEKFIDYNIDVIGLSEEYYRKSKDVILNFVENLYGFTEKLKSNDYAVEDIEKLSEEIDLFLGRDNVGGDLKFKKVSDNNRGKTLAELTSDKSDLELFENHRLIKTSDGYYQKVNVKDTLEESYNEAVQAIIRNPKVVNNHFLKSLPFFKNGLFNQVEIQKQENVDLVKERFKEFVIKESNKLNEPSLRNRTEVAQKWTIYKILNKNPLNTEKMPNTSSELFKYQKYRGNYHYLTNSFHSDFQNYILENKFNNTSLYNNVLKYFEVNETGIHLNTDFIQIQERIKNSYLNNEIFDNLKQYALLSKQSSMKDLFEYEEDVDRGNSKVDFERYYYSNNFSQMKSFKGDYRVDGDILVANNTSENFIRVKEGLFEKVSDLEGNSVYGRQTVIEDSRFNNFEYELKRPKIDLDLAKTMIVQTDFKPVKMNNLFKKGEKEAVFKELNGCK